MVKRDGEWYALFVLKKTVELVDEPETFMAIDRGERNLAIAVAISKANPDKPMRGQFWRGLKLKGLEDYTATLEGSLEKRSS
jgi:transposase